MKSIKLAIIAALGFSTACSTVKDSTKSKPKEDDKIEVAPSIVVMYGVRRPVESIEPVKKAEKPSPTQTPTTEAKPANESK